MIFPTAIGMRFAVFEKCTPHMSRLISCLVFPKARVTLHTTAPTCTQPSIAQHTTGQVADKMAVRGRVDSAPNQADFVHLCIRGTIVTKALFLMRVRHTLGKAINCKGYSKGKKGICKHTAWDCLGRIYARLCAQCATNWHVWHGDINQEHDIVHKNSTAFVFSDLSYCGANVDFLWVSNLNNFMMNWNQTLSSGL